MPWYSWNIAESGVKHKKKRYTCKYILYIDEIVHRHPIKHNFPQISVFVAIKRQNSNNEYRYNACVIFILKTEKKLFQNTSNFYLSTYVLPCILVSVTVNTIGLICDNTYFPGLPCHTTSNMYMPVLDTGYISM